MEKLRIFVISSIVSLFIALAIVAVDDHAHFVRLYD